MKTKEVKVLRQNIWLQNTKRVGGILAWPGGHATQCLLRKPCEGLSKLLWHVVSDAPFGQPSTSGILVQLELQKNCLRTIRAGHRIREQMGRYLIALLIPLGISTGAGVSSCLRTVSAEGRIRRPLGMLTVSSTKKSGNDQFMDYLMSVILSFCLAWYTTGLLRGVECLVVCGCLCSLRKVRISEDRTATAGAL